MLLLERPFINKKRDLVILLFLASSSSSSSSSFFFFFFFFSHHHHHNHNQQQQQQQQQQQHWYLLLVAEDTSQFTSLGRSQWLSRLCQVVRISLLVPAVIFVCVCNQDDFTACVVICDDLLVSPSFDVLWIFEYFFRQNFDLKACFFLRRLAENKFEFKENETDLLTHKILLEEIPWWVGFELLWISVCYWCCVNVWISYLPFVLYFVLFECYRLMLMVLMLVLLVLVRDSARQMWCH